MALPVSESVDYNCLKAYIHILKAYELVSEVHCVEKREKLLSGSAVTPSHRLLITHRNKHKSSSLPAELKGNPWKPRC